MTGLLECREAVPFETMLLQVSRVLAIAGLAYALPKVFSGQVGLDFRLIWIAGKLWASGLNPYGPEFAIAYALHFDAGPISAFWVYPPHWFPIAAPLALLPAQVASTVWSSINLALMLAATLLVAGAAVREAIPARATIFYLGLAYVCLMQATAVTFSIGQTSVLLYFGLSSMLYGTVTGRSLALIVDLFTLSLKPNVGLAAFAAVSVLPRFRWALIPVATLCVLCAAPVFWTGAPGNVIVGFLQNLGRYSDPTIAANAPPNLIGFAHFLPAGAVASPYLRVLTILAAMAAGLLFAMRPFDIRTFSIFVTSTVLLVPLPTYDAVPMAIVATVVVGTGHLSLLIITGLAITLRPSNLFHLLGVGRTDSTIFPESSVATVGLIAVFVGLLASMAKAPEPVTRKRGLPL